MPSNGQLYLIGGGVAAITLAFLWRIASRHHQVSRLQRRFRRADEPIERARAGNELVELGLRRAARVVLRAMPNEADNRVRQSLALAVARRQWEPSGAKRVVELRRWAADQLGTTGQVSEFAPAVTRLSDMGGPRLPPREPAPTSGAPTPAATPNGHGPPTEPSIPSVAQAEPGIRWMAPTDGGQP